MLRRKTVFYGIENFIARQTSRIALVLNLNTKIYGAQRQEFPANAGNSSFGMYGKNGTDPVLISFDPYYVTWHWTPGGALYPVYGFRLNSQQMLRHPTNTPDPAMVVHNYPYWTNSDCSHYDLPNTGARFSEGTDANYMMQLGEHRSNRSARTMTVPRFIQGDEVGDAAGASCTGPYLDVTNTELLLGRVNVVQVNAFASLWDENDVNQSLSGTFLNSAPLHNQGFVTNYCDAISNAANFRLHPGKTQKELTVSPNPASAMVIVRWGATRNGPEDQGEILLINQLGQSIFRWSGALSASEVKLDLTNSPTGLYIIQCRVNGELKATTKLSVTK